MADSRVSATQRKARHPDMRPSEPHNPESWKAAMHDVRHTDTTTRLSTPLSKSMTRKIDHAMRMKARDVHFHVAHVSGVSLQVVYAQSEKEMNRYKVCGDHAAISLLNRLSASGEDATTIRGSISSITPVTLDEVAKEAAGIPMAAKFFAFAYPLECLAADNAKLIEMVIGSVSRLDDDLFFLFLLGGYIYFDESQNFLQANAISLKKTNRQLRFGGPFAVAPDAAAFLKASGRLRPLLLKSLNEVGLTKFGWINPREHPGGFKLHESMDWNSGAFVYQRSDGELVFYHTRGGDKDHTRGGTRINRSHMAVQAKHLAKTWMVERRGFDQLQATFEQELTRSKQLRASLMQRKGGPVERWLRSYGIIIIAYYAIGVVLFHYVEGFSWFDCIYFMTVTATTVGYGDLSPVTWQGRLLSIVYMPFGTIVTMGGLLQPVGFCLTHLNKLNALVISKLLALAKVLDDLLNRSMRAVAFDSWEWLQHQFRSHTAWRINSSQTFTIETTFGKSLEAGPATAYAHTVLQPIVVALLGCVVTSLVKSLTFIDSLYYGIVTMTTVGYGDSDLLPDTDAEKAYTILFMLFSTSAFAVCVERLAMLVTSRSIFIRDFNWELPAMMRRRAIQEGNMSPTLVEDEFVIYVLESYGVVDSDLLKCIRDDFKKIEQFGLHPHGSNGEIEVTTLFEHLVARGLVLDSNRIAPSSTRSSRNLTRDRKASLNQTTRGLVDKVTLNVKGTGPSLPSVMVVDMSTPDHGFDEWHKGIWTPFLQRDTEFQEAEMQRRVSQNRAGDSKPIRFAVVRGLNDRVSRRPSLRPGTSQGHMHVGEDYDDAADEIGC